MPRLARCNTSRLPGANGFQTAARRGFVVRGVSGSTAVSHNLDGALLSVEEETCSGTHHPLTLGAFEEAGDPSLRTPRGGARRAREPPQAQEGGLRARGDYQGDAADRGRQGSL